MAMEQTQTLALLERLGGCISLVSVLLIFIAYGLVPRVRNPRNTFIVFASIANLGASIACIIARDGLERGEDSALCRTQSFMLHMFMQSDAWWSLGMSFNTFLVIVFRTNPNSFHMWPYCLVCFGGPFSIALTLLFISDPTRGPVYGKTYVWCWIRDDWANIRIFTSYIFVSVCILGSAALNIIVGYRIFHSRNQIRHFPHSQIQDTSSNGQAHKAKPPSSREDSAHPIIVTEVFVTHAPASPIVKPNMTPTHSTFRISGSPPQEVPNIYSSTQVFAKAGNPAEKMSQIRRIMRAAKKFVFKFHIQDPVKRAYLRTTFLFTLSVLVSWTPATINRIRSSQGPDPPSSYQVAMVAVMPLQGLWNAVIFFMTSHRVLRDWMRDKCDVRASGSTKINELVMERTVEETNVDEDDDHTDSGSDIELRQRESVPAK
ncbi:hypothetical protein BGZ61DRAFT_490213 [Ilyonectria robusta]|uniref:uncharacterized protein n=1 Tax=Ilyonectria robusta TaxID=1079257 RepID=UPI001E8CE684|nr:uncharacterized protein BGZ61DRAFT_490213 [Ilyonectria robusta]KAH8736597.1 hypothetical protein BGZ61DRAFT_490213 [Ilyonectria robusta]